MTVDTKAALEAAIDAHIAEQCDGNLVTHYALIAATTTMADIGSGATSYFLEANSHQPLHVTIGLLSVGIDRVSNMDDDDD